MPLDWAMAQNNLGAVLRELGSRESGTARLEEAVAAYRAALQELSRERAPLDWAAVWYNLGAALRLLGEREAGTTRLQEAMVAFRAALQERTRERVPLDWAHTQRALAHALAALAGRERKEDAGRTMEEAVGRMRGAVQVYRQVGDAYWLPRAQRRAVELEAELAKLKR